MVVGAVLSVEDDDAREHTEHSGVEMAPVRHVCAVFAPTAF